MQPVCLVFYHLTKKFSFVAKGCFITRTFPPLRFSTNSINSTPSEKVVNVSTNFVFRSSCYGLLFIFLVETIAVIFVAKTLRFCNHIGVTIIFRTVLTTSSKFLSSNQMIFGRKDDRVLDTKSRDLDLDLM